MSDILKEVRSISSQKVAEKQKKAETNYPKLIEKIKSFAGWGKTQAEFNENEMDEYSKRLLEQDGFSVYITTKRDENLYSYKSGDRKVWIVSW